LSGLHLGNSAILEFSANLPRRNRFMSLCVPILKVLDILVKLKAPDVLPSEVQTLTNGKNYQSMKVVFASSYSRQTTI